MLVLNKIDVVRPEQLSEENKAALQALRDDGLDMITSSTMTDENLMEVRQKVPSTCIILCVSNALFGALRRVSDRTLCNIPLMRDTARPVTNSWPLASPSK